MPLKALAQLQHGVAKLAFRILCHSQSHSTMKKNNKNKGKKSLTAVGAVVAAGLTPGIVTGIPVSQSPGHDVEITAADAVSINGETFDFDDLFAMQQQQINRDMSKMYGPPPVSVREHDEKKLQEDLREQARLDSIRRAQEARALIYGPPPVRYVSSNPEEIRALILSVNKDEAIDNIQYKLQEYISFMFNTRPNRIRPDEEIIKDLEPDQQAGLLQEVENSFGVQLTDDMLTQLNTVYRLAKFIVEVISPITE